MKRNFTLIAVSSAVMLGACAHKKEVVYVDRPGPVRVRTVPVKPSSAVRETPPAPEPRQNNPEPRPSRVAQVGVWVGDDNGQQLVLEISSNGHLGFMNAGGDHAGRWEARGNDQFAVEIGGRSGVFTMLDSSTGTLRVGGATVRMRRQ